MSYYSNSLITCKNLTPMMHAFRNNGFMKVKMPIKGAFFYLLEKIDFYQCDLATTQNMKNINNFRSQLSTVVLKIPAYVLEFYV